MKILEMMVLFFLFINFLLFAQEEKLFLERIDSSQFPKTRIFVRVEKGDETVKGLNSDNFKLLADGKEIPGFRFGTVFSSREWLAIGLAIDTSGSMKGNAIKDAKIAAKDFISRTGVQDRISLVSFSSQAKLEISSTVSKEEVENKITNLKANGNTAFLDTINLSIGLLAKQFSPRKTLVVLTDGKDTSSKTGKRETIEMIKKHKAPIYSIGLGKDINESLLKELSGITGGKYFHAPTSSELMKIYREISRELENSYFFEFSFPLKDKKDMQQVHKVSVSLNIPGLLLTKERKFLPANVSFVSEKKPTERERQKKRSISIFSFKEFTPQIYYALVAGFIASIILILIFKAKFFASLLIVLLVEIFSALIIIIYKLLV